MARMAWRSDVRMVAIPTCPLCHRRIDVAAVVNAADAGQGASDFWGRPGHRWLQCERHGAWVHISVRMASGAIEHRLAYLAPRAWPDAVPQLVLL